MRWTRRRAGGGMVEDRRGAGGGLGMPMRLGAGLGLPGILIVLVLAVLNGGLGGGGGGAGGGFGGAFDGFDPAGQRTGAAPAGQAKLFQFVEFVFDDVQSMWAREFQQAG